MTIMDLPPREFRDRLEIVASPPAAPIVRVRKTTEAAAVCPDCKREMTLNQAERIPRDGWSWLWWSCECGSVTAALPVRLKRTNGVR